MEIRAGIPATILNAWLAWYHRNVEDIETNYNSGERDEWGWSATNVVSDSNHLSGTAVDINATQYPWGVDASVNMPPERIAKIREGLRLFEGSIYWGQDWNRRDPMHFQLNWPEWDARNAAFAKKLEEGYLGIYADEPDAPLPSPLPASGGVLWADVSQYQRPADDSYPQSDPGRALQLGLTVATPPSRRMPAGRRSRSTRGAWTRSVSTTSSALVRRTATYIESARAGRPVAAPEVFTMVDVEGAGGQIRGNHTRRDQRRKCSACRLVRRQAPRDRLPEPEGRSGPVEPASWPEARRAALQQRAGPVLRLPWPIRPPVQRSRRLRARSDRATRTSPP
ncbi:hypothetical protein GS415_10405 [Rhodococcus hoagii]|nr:hypothetical protein [Prescottella equi]